MVNTEKTHNTDVMRQKSSPDPATSTPLQRIEADYSLFQTLHVGPGAAHEIQFLTHQCRRGGMLSDEEEWQSALQTGSVTAPYHIIYAFTIHSLALARQAMATFPI